MARKLKKFLAKRAKFNFWSWEVVVGWGLQPFEGNFVLTSSIRSHTIVARSSSDFRSGLTRQLSQHSKSRVVYWNIGIFVYSCIVRVGWRHVLRWCDVMCCLVRVARTAKLQGERRVGVDLLPHPGRRTPHQRPRNGNRAFGPLITADRPLCVVCALSIKGRFQTPQCPQATLAPLPRSRHAANQAVYRIWKYHGKNRK